MRSCVVAIVFVGCSSGRPADPPSLDAVVAISDGAMMCTIPRELDLLSDDHNCGAPCHDCTLCGGTCVGGQCTPMVLAGGPGFSSPRGIAVDGELVYWVDEGDTGAATGKILSISKHGGRPTELATEQFGPWQIAVSGGFVYWTNSGFADRGTFKMPVGGGPRTAVYPNAPFDWAANASNLVFGLAAGFVTVPFSTESPLVLDPTSTRIGVAVDTTDAFYSTDEALFEIRSVPLTGGAHHTLATSTRVPFGMAVDHGTVFLTEPTIDGNLDHGAIASVPVGGGTITTLLSPVNQPSWIVADAAAIYWLNAKGELTKANRDGSNPTVLARASSPVELAIDEHCVYFDDFSGPLMTVAK